MAAAAYSALLGGLPCRAAHLQPLATQGIPLGKGRHLVEFPAPGLPPGIPARGGHLRGLPDGQGAAAWDLLLLQARPARPLRGAGPDDTAAVKWALQRAQVGLCQGLSEVQSAGEAGAHVRGQEIARDVRAGPKSGRSSGSSLDGHGTSAGRCSGNGSTANAESV